MRFVDLRIGTRLGLGFAFIFLLVALMTAVGSYRLRDVKNITLSLAEQQSQAGMDALEWQGLTQSNIVRAMAILKSPDPAGADAFFKNEMSQTTAKISTLQKRIEESELSDQARALLAEIAKVRQDYVSSRAQALKIYLNGDRAAGDQSFDTRVVPAMQRYVSLIQRFVDEQRTQIAAVGATASSKADFAASVLVLLGIGVLASGCLVAWLVTRSITQPLARAVELAQAVADGNLGTAVGSDRRDEIGELLAALGEMTDKLRQVVGQVRAATESITTASTQIAAGNLDLSSRTEEQASSLQQTAASMTQLTTTVKSNADNADQASRLVSEAAQVATRGGQAVAEVVATMGEIHERAGKIVDLIGVIDSIAFQTNILALNAAVESARAGEQGRGFAVVASEVRLLAQRSAEAAREIKALINSSVEKVQAGSRLTDTAGNTMNEVVAAVQHIETLMSEMANASREQSTGIEQINAAVTQMDQVTQHNAALVEESAAAAESLKAQAQALSQTVDHFRLQHSAALQGA